MKPLYRYSFYEATYRRDVKQWKSSHRENVRCKETVDALVADRFDGTHLNGEVIKEICSEFSVDRTQWVLANTVNERSGDGRFRPDTREWAKQVGIPADERNMEFSLCTHPEIVNGLVGLFRQYLREELGLMGRSDCVPSDVPQNYEHQLLLLKPEILAEQYKNGENQLFYATGGFGCKPSAGDKKVFGQFLNDGEKSYFFRTDFLGIADEHKLPEWAVQKLKELRTEQTGTEGGITLK